MDSGVHWGSIVEKLESEFKIFNYFVKTSTNLLSRSVKLWISSPESFINSFPLVVGTTDYPQCRSYKVDADGVYILMTFAHGGRKHRRNSNKTFFPLHYTHIPPPRSVFSYESYNIFSLSTFSEERESESREEKSSANIYLDDIYEKRIFV